MFRLVTVEDTVRIKPADTAKPLRDAILAELDGSYLDKVIIDVGLVVAIYDLKEVSGGILHHGEGAPHYRAIFRLLIFRPFPGEILRGKITLADEHGLSVSVGFFDNIAIPAEQLPTDTFYRHAERAWCWQTEEADLWLERGEEVTLKVTEIVFSQPPMLGEIKSNQDTGAAPGAGASVPPMEIVGSFADEGLGCVAWWQEDDG